jgi:hypothetical protein
MDSKRIVKSNLSGYASKAAQAEGYGTPSDNIRMALESMGFEADNISEAMDKLGLTEEEIAAMGPRALEEEASQEWIRSLLYNDYKKFLSKGTRDINDPNNHIDIVFPDAGEQEIALGIVAEVIAYADSVRDRGADYWMKFVDSRYPLENMICRMLIQDVDYTPTWYRKWKTES